MRVSNMDQAFKEESAKLAQVEKRIGEIAKPFMDTAKSLDKEIHDYICVDYEDVDRKRALISQRKNALAQYANYKEYKDMPYFGRLDLDREIETGYELYTNYIGKKGLTVGSEVIIVDWRAPVGACYYAQNQTSFRIKGDTYSLSLRRALNIKSGKLIDCRTEYDGSTVSLEGDVIDPFLLTVLKDKRRQNRLTDIIRSIQANQNDIIRRPLSESFIVQGCAGSGKTMILLHRLSYLKFNNRNMSVSGIKIITPNKDFNTHINELSAELDIDSIPKMTVEEYYAHLIKRFTRSETVNSDVASEMGLNPNLLGEIYSEQFAQRIQELYNKHWCETLDGMDQSMLRRSFSMHGVTYPQTDIYNSATVSYLESGIHRILVEAKERMEQYAASQRRIEGLRAELREAQDASSRMAEEVDTIRSQIKISIQDLLKETEKEIQLISDSVLHERTRYQELKSTDSGVSDSTLQAKEEIRLLRENYAAYIDYDRFSHISDDVSKGITEACAETVQRATDLVREMQSIPAYSFVKRNALRRQLEASKAQFSESARQHLDALIKEKESLLANQDEQTRIIQDEMKALAKTLEEADVRIDRLKGHATSIRECISVLDSAETVELSGVLSAEAQHICADFLPDYDKLIANQKRQLAHADEIEKKIAGVIVKEPYDEDIDYLEECSASVSRLKANTVYVQVVRKELQACYKKHGQDYTRTNYRHKLYLLLLFGSMYYPRLSTGDSFLNIDEAQDISVAEYKLLRKILGDKCIFNLYGDINQALFEQKSIVDWDDLRGVLGDKIYVLNEDYRNTLQITEYCNKQFYSEIYPIGITGEPVKEAELNSAIRWIVQLKKENPGYRTAVIAQRRNDNLRSIILSILEEQDVSWYAVDDKKLSVLSVENAKGLEFEAVVVLAKGMEINEQYISYTRALDHLCIVQ